MPSVQRAYDTLQDQGGTVVTIAIDGDGQNAVSSYRAKYRYTVPMLIDTGMEVARKFGVRGVPTTYVINRQGMIVAAGFGPVDIDRPEFRAYLQALLTQPGK